MKKIGIILGCILLAGCGNVTHVLSGPIGTVKGYKYEPEANNVTIGAALDNRRMCSEVAWKNGKTDSGKDIVTYICRLTGYNNKLKAKGGRIPEILEQRIAFTIEGKKTAKPVYCDFYYKFPGEKERNVRNQACFKMAYDSNYNANWDGLWLYMSRN